MATKTNKVEAAQDYRMSQEYREHIFTIGFNGESAEKLLVILKKFVYPEYSLDYINSISSILSTQWAKVQEAKQTKKKTK